MAIQGRTLRDERLVDVLRLLQVAVGVPAVEDRRTSKFWQVVIALWRGIHGNEEAAGLKTRTRDKTLCGVTNRSKSQELEVEGKKRVETMMEKVRPP